MAIEIAFRVLTEDLRHLRTSKETFEKMLDKGDEAGAAKELKSILTYAGYIHYHLKEVELAEPTIKPSSISIQVGFTTISWNVTS